MPYKANEQPVEQIVARLCARTNDGADLQALPWTEQVVVLVYGAQGVIDNGGLVYFYESDWPGNPSYALFADAYTAIGAQEMADCIRNTAALFAFPEPHLDCEMRCRYLDDYKADATGVFMKCDDVAVGQGEETLTLLAAYVRAHGLVPAG